MSEARAPRGIDPRGPRFVASVTAVLLAVDVVLALTGISTARGLGGFLSVSGTRDFAFVGGSDWAIVNLGVIDRLLDPGFLLLLVIALLFLWGVLSPRTAPWAVLFRTAIQPRLTPPRELEDARPPRFAQGVGLLVATVGLLLHLIGVPWALPISAAIAFVAAFLNAAFGLCLGCQLYLLLQRAGLIGRARTA